MYSYLPLHSNIFISLVVEYYKGFPSGSDGKESACSTGDPGLILGPEDPLEEEMATHFRILAWRIPWAEEPWWATVHGVPKS